MKRVPFIVAAAITLLSSCGNRHNNGNPAPDGSESDLTVLVGSYSQPGDTSLLLLSFDPVNGTFRHIDGSKEISNTSYFTQSPGGMIYVVSEGDSVTARITAINPQGPGRAPRYVSSHPVGSGAPCYVSVSPDGRFVVTADYMGGTASVFPIAPDGAVKSLVQRLHFSGSGPVKGRQDTPHPHCVAFTPDSSFMLVDDLGTDRISIFALARGADTLLVTPAVSTVRMPAASGPRHIVFNRKGDRAYLINEISDSVTVFSYSPGSLLPVQSVAADTVGAHGAGDIHLSPDGHHLYASLRLKNDGIAAFAVDSVTGRLTRIGHTPTLPHPRNFAIAPDGRFLLVASKDGDAIQILSRDPATGRLKDTGRRYNIKSPACVRFIRH